MIALGVDLGGTKIAAGLVGGDGRVLASVRRPTPRGSAAAIVDAIAIVITDLLGETSGVDAIGIAVAGLVEARSGRVLHAVNLPLDQLALGTILEERLERRVSIVNDGNAAAVAEHFLGAARGTRYSITLTLGTGVGGGVIVDNALLGDRFGTGAELGHIVINAHGPLCQGGCPNHGCLEALASGRRLSAAPKNAVSTSKRMTYSRSRTAATRGRKLQSARSGGRSASPWRPSPTSSTRKYSSSAAGSRLRRHRCCCMKLQTSYASGRSPVIAMRGLPSLRSENTRHSSALRGSLPPNAKPRRSVSDNRGGIRNA